MCRDIADWTASDPVLQQVLKKVQQGCGDKCPDPGLQPFYIRRDELSTHNRCILWGNRVVVPARGQQQLLEDLHTADRKDEKFATQLCLVAWAGWRY